jgi:hypothetical protein
MIPHDKLTVIRNRFRAHELREFRKWVEVWYERSDRDADDVVVDWEGAQAARSHLNRMLPRIMQIVHAAGFGETAPAGTVSDPGIALGRAHVLQRIFNSRLGDGVDQEIFDVIDMAIGVYDSDLAPALLRSINPLYYAGRLMAFVTRGPRRFLRSLGFGRRAGSVDEARLLRLEAVAARLREVEDLIDSRFGTFQDHQSRHRADLARQLAELEERLDFVERVLSRPGEPKRLPNGSEEKIITPV